MFHLIWAIKYANCASYLSTILQIYFICWFHFSKKSTNSAQLVNYKYVNLDFEKGVPKKKCKHDHAYSNTQEMKFLIWGRGFDLQNFKNLSIV